MTDYSIETSAVRRSFGAVSVLQGVDLRVPRGSIYGFLGRNGAGKTTLIKLLAGLIRPSAGSLRVLGRDPWDFTASDREKVGYLSEKQNLPPMLKVKTLIRLCRDLYPAWDTALCDDLLSRFQIAVNRRVYTLSQGNLRMLGIILALAPRPEVILLDEPAANLDVVARREFLDEILALIRDGDRTVFFSTHILSDVERVADQVGILAQGKLMVSEPLDTLKESIRQVRFFDFAGPLPERPPDVLNWKQGDGEILAILRDPRENAPADLAARWRCRHEVHPLSLEDIFVEISKAQARP